MDEFYWRSHIPAFGSWDCHHDLPFTQCFHSARQPHLLRVLYDNHVFTPALIVVPRRPGKAVYPNPEGKKDAWAMCNCECNCKMSPRAVDEDLYKISPRLLRQPKRKRGWRIFSSCLRACVS